MENILTCTMSHGPEPRFSARLRDLGVKGNKHIPTLYLRSAYEQRLALLQGLMDSDGYIADRGVAEYTSISQPVGARSPGACAHSRSEGGLGKGGGHPLRQGEYRTNGELLFTPTIYVASLPRKADRLTRISGATRGDPLDPADVNGTSARPTTPDPS